MSDKCAEMSENANEMRDRLVELVAAAKNAYYDYSYEKYEKGLPVEKSEVYIADHLLANGMILPPCKVGDMVHFVLEDLDEETDGKFISSQRINEVGTRGIFVSDSLSEENCRIFVPYSDFGENVFLSKEEAERALKGGE